MNTNVKGNQYTQLEGMSTYIGTKISGAKPMNRLEYDEYRGWDLPDDEDGSDTGYIVQYEDGYITWSPSSQFEDSYRKTDGINFGLAIEAMKKGLKVCRVGWNGKGMFLFLVHGCTFNVNRPPLLGIYEEGTQINYHAHIDMKTANDQVVPWLASQTDMLADDWMLVD